MVGINVPIPVPLAYHSFGGWKSSSFGDLNQHGTDSIKFWTRTKTVTAPLAVGHQGRRRILHADDEVRPASPSFPNWASLAEALFRWAAPARLTGRPRCLSLRAAQFRGTDGRASQHH